MTFPVELFLMLGVSMLFSSIGFYRFRYFSSVGYGLSIAACGAVLLLLFRNDAEPVLMVACFILMAFGLRLAAYLFLRSKGNGAYSKKLRREMNEETQDMGVSIIMWVFCGVLYAVMVSPLCYRLTGGGHLDASVTAGVIIMAAGFLLEAGADGSKVHQKKKYPGEVCRRGLYRFVRCPNYFGEILFWSGVFILGITSFKTAGQWIIAGLGYLGILIVMFSAARRLEMMQNRKYGDDPKYRRYVKRVPIIVPLLPLHSLSRQKDGE